MKKPRLCTECNNPLVRPPDEPAYTWKIRLVCSKACGIVRGRRKAKELRQHKAGRWKNRNMVGRHAV